MNFAALWSCFAENSLRCLSWWLFYLSLRALRSSPVQRDWPFLSAREIRGVSRIDPWRQRLASSFMFVDSNEAGTRVIPLHWWRGGKSNSPEWEVLHSATRGGWDIFLHVALHKRPQVQGVGLAGCAGDNLKTTHQLKHSATWNMCALFCLANDIKHFYSAQQRTKAKAKASEMCMCALFSTKQLVKMKCSHGEVSKLSESKKYMIIFNHITVRVVNLNSRVVIFCSCRP